MPRQPDPLKNELTDAIQRALSSINTVGLSNLEVYHMREVHRIGTSQLQITMEKAGPTGGPSKRRRFDVKLSEPW